MKTPTILIGIVICIAFLNVANVGPLFGPLLYTMTPLQRYYAADYLASTWHQNDPAATTETRLLWKTKKGKSELATGQDLMPLPLGDVIGKYSPELFALSDKARAEGWTGVSKASSREVKSAMLENILEQQIYDGNKVWRFFLEPAFGLATLIVIGFIIRAWRRERWTWSMWDTRGRIRRLSFWTWSVEVSDRVAKRLLLRPTTPEILSATPTRQLELQVPAPQRILTAPAAPSDPKASPESVVVHPPVTTPPAKNRPSCTPFRSLPRPRQSRNLRSFGMSRRGLIEQIGPCDVLH